MGSDAESFDLEALDRKALDRHRNQNENCELGGGLRVASCLVPMLCVGTYCAWRSALLPRRDIVMGSNAEHGNQNDIISWIFAGLGAFDYLA